MFPVIDVIPSRRTPVVSIAFIALCTVIFVGELSLGDAERTALFDAYGSAAGSAWWPALITGQFIHEGWLHFLSNMVCLWIFGDNVEDRLGHERFAVFLIGCGVAAALVQSIAFPSHLQSLIGASGAIAGTLGAYFVFYPYSRVLTIVYAFIYSDLVEVPAILFLAAWLMLQIFTGVGALTMHTYALPLAAIVAGFAVGAVVAVAWRATESGLERWNV